MTNALAKRVLLITSNYLGPEARRFLDRQIRHVDKDLLLEDIKQDHIEKLAWWVFVSGKLIMQDEKAKKMSDEVRSLLSVASK